MEEVQILSLSQLLHDWQQHGKELKELAQLTGISASYLTLLSHGRRKGKPETLRKIAEALGIKPTQIAGFADLLSRYERKTQQIERPDSG